MLRVWLLLMAVVVLALAAGQVGDSASSMPPRKAIPSVYVCLNATELQLADTNKAVSVYVDGEGFRPAALYVEGVVVEGRFLNFTEPVQTLIAPPRPQRVCLDLPLSRQPVDRVVREAENYAKRRGLLHAVSTSRGRGYILVEDRAAEVPPIVKWPGDAERARRETTRDVTPRREVPEVATATAAATGEVVGYIKSVVFNFTRHPGGCGYTRSRIALPNGTLWIEVVLTNATTRGTYHVYVDLYNSETGTDAIIYDYYGQVVTVDKRSVTYLARHIDVPSTAQNRPVFVEVWICGPQGIRDGYLLFRVRTSRYHADYVRYPIQPGARVIVKNAFTQSYNTLSNTTHAIFPPVELPPGHWAGTGRLTADFTIRLCTESSTTPPPSYFQVNLYYGPYWIGSTSVASYTCGTEPVYTSLYCCRYRANVWSWINTPDSIATQFGLRAPMGLPIILGPLPTPSNVIYADVFVNAHKYEGQRRPDVAPPDSSVFMLVDHNFAHVVLQYWNAWGTSGTAARLDIVTQYSEGSRRAPYISIAVSPIKIVHGTRETVFSLPRNVEVVVSADAPITSVPAVPSDGKTLVSNPSVRAVWEAVSALADYLGILSQGLSTASFVVKDPRVGAAAYAISFVSLVGQHLARASVSTFSTRTITDRSVAVTINIGFSEATMSHQVAIVPRVSGNILYITGVTIREELASYIYSVGARSPLDVWPAGVDVYYYRNFFCGFNEVPDRLAPAWCNYQAFR